MSTLTEIEAAADSLSSEEKRELFVFLAQRLREDSGPDATPEPRTFAPERMAGWIERDEADLRRFRGEG